MTLGERIKSRRVELDLTVDDVALALNKNKATVYRYESNEITNLPMKILEPLAKILKTSLAYLLGWTDSPNDDYKASPYHPELSEGHPRAQDFRNLLNANGQIFDEWLDVIIDATASGLDAKQVQQLINVNKALLAQMMQK